MLVHSLVVSRVDFFNSVLYRVAAVHLHRLKSVLNAAARIVLKLRKLDRVSISRAFCNQLHWLPIDQRAPSYLSSLCVPLLSVTTRRHMWDATMVIWIFSVQELLHFVLLLMQFLDLHCMCWNSPPSTLKLSSLQPEQFRKQLKTTLMAQPS